MRHLIRGISVALALVAIGAAVSACSSSAAVEAPAPPSAVAPPAQATADGSIRLTIRLAPGGAEVISRVETDAPSQRRDPFRNEPTFFRVLDVSGRVLAERGFRLETALRSELPDADGALTGARVPLAAPIASIQVPRLAGATAVRLYRKAAPAPELLAEVKP
jgi:hypothetical protein